jgi:imidazolonepropionase-like amidohydrolase
MILRVLASALLAVAAFAETNVFENFTLIDGSGKAAVSGAAMVVTDGKIVYAGPKAGANAPAGAKKIDLTGKFVMPGIINLHGHLGSVSGLAQDPKFYTRENLQKQLNTYAQYGVTAVISMGSDQPPILQKRAEQRAGRPGETRIYTAYKGFTGPGGYPTLAPGMKGVPYEVTTVTEVEKAVAELAKQKVDIVKIWVDDHLGKEQKIPMNLSAAIISNAQKHGLKVAAHIFYLDDAKGLVNAGLYGLVHSVRDKPVDQALIDMMKKKGAWQGAATLTRELSTFVYAKRHPFLDDPFFTKSVEKDTLATLKSAGFQDRFQKDPDLAKYSVFLKTAQQNLKKLADAGVKFGFGTDSGPPARFSGYFEHWEAELMVEAGLTPMQVIQSFSHHAAEFLNAKDLGTLEAGHWADMVVLNRNPLQDIKNTRSIDSVYIAGNKVK